MKAIDQDLPHKLNKHTKAEAELKVRLRQQTTVAELGQRALVGAELSALMDDATLLVTQALGAEFSNIAEFISAENMLTLKAGTGWQKGWVGQLSLDIDNNSQAGYTFLTGNPIIVQDINQETRFNKLPLMDKHKVISGMSVVIQGKDQKFGVLSVHTTQPRLFTEDDIHFLQAIANILVSAIERKQAEAQIVQRNRELLTLQLAGAAISSSLDIDYVLTTVTTEMAKLLQVNACAISDWDEVNYVITTLSMYGPDAWQDKTVVERTPSLSQYPLTQEVLAEQHIVQITPNHQDLAQAEQGFMLNHQIKAHLMIPIMFQGRVIGLVDIMDTQTERIFTDQQIGLAKFLVNQAATAIENARLHTETRRILKEQLAIREAGAAISSTLDLDTVLNHIAEQMGQVLDVTSTYICDFNAETLYSTVLAKYVAAQACTQEQVSNVGTHYQMSQDFPSSVECLQLGDPEIIQITNPTLADSERTRMEQFCVKTSLIIPMHIGNEIIGYADLWESRQQRSFSPQEITLGQDIAQQAAIAIENARLFKQTKQALDETAALYRVARQLAQIDNEQEMFELVLAKYLQSLNLQQGGVLLINNDQSYSVLQAHIIKGKLVEQGLRNPIFANSPLNRLIKTQEIVIINDISQENLTDGGHKIIEELGIQSMLMIPLMVRSKVIGALEADATEKPHVFSEREVNLAKGMVNQLSIGIENIRL
ncbi:MAG: GAF domain-containing protein, partial [Psychromonas sp.]|nr:GAF domain-containing protein [Psychromonas sp.]